MGTLITRPCYYSGNQVFGSVTTQDMLQPKTCYKTRCASACDYTVFAMAKNVQLQMRDWFYAVEISKYKTLQKCPRMSPRTIKLSTKSVLKLRMLLQQELQLIFARNLCFCLPKNTEINWPKIVVNKARYGDYVNLSLVLR